MATMSFDRWPLWKRALVANAIAASGVILGFASSGAKLSPEYSVPIAVYTFAFIDFMFLAVRPRIMADRAIGTPKPTLSGIALDIVRERRFIVVLVVIQLLAVSRAATSAAKFIKWSHSSYVHSLSNASTIAPRMVAMSGVMAGVALIWLLSAIGLWRRRSWAWWLALVLNGLATGISLILQLLRWGTYLLDAPASIAVVLLLLPRVRTEFRSTLVVPATQSEQNRR
jgi:uncharacterized membrane protein (DUF2068 family)